LAQNSKFIFKINLLSTTDLTKVLDRTVEALSGGELQRFAIAVVAVQEADMWVFHILTIYENAKPSLL